MINWTEILTTVLSAASIVAIVAFVAKSIFETYMNRRVDKYKHELNLVLEGHKLKLDKEKYEHQIMFANLYQERAKAIQQLHSMLLEVENSLSKVGLHIEMGENAEAKEIDSSIMGHLIDMKMYLEANRLYFSDELCNKIDLILSEITNNGLTTMIKTYNESSRGAYMRRNPIDFLNNYGKNFDRSVIDKVNRARIELAKDFRQLINVQ